MGRCTRATIMTYKGETRYRAAAPLLLAIQGHTREDKAKGSLEKERRMDIRALKMLAIGDITVRA
jgi:hypothetical protein